MNHVTCSLVSKDWELVTNISLDISIVNSYNYVEDRCHSRYRVYCFVTNPSAEVVASAR